MIDCPSPNFDERALPVSMIVLHYTGMPDAKGALDWLTSPESKVSSHYFVAEDGQALRLVPDDKRAWHAGRSWWRGVTDVNSASIGIEIVNPGHEWGYRPFPDAQIDSVATLVRDLVQRHGVEPRNVVGHSDVAPQRKDDPGELFPWPRLAAERLAVPIPAPEGDPGWTGAGFGAALARWGYDTSDLVAATRAFQRRFRPSRVDGVIDADCRALLLALHLAAERPPQGESSART